MKPLPNIYEASLSLPVVWKWGKRVGFSILDQGLFSGTNFVLSILLGRWLPPDVYGAYAVAYAIMLIIAGIQSSLVYEPMMVYGPTQFQTNLGDYISKLSKLQLGLTIPLSAVMIVISLLLEPISREAVFGMAIVIPFYIAFWFLRQSCYIDSRPGLAAVSSSIYFVTSVIGLLILIFIDRLTLTNFYGLIIFSSIGGITFLTIFLIRKSANTSGIYSYMEIVRVHWNYGRWILPATIANSAAVLIIIPAFSLLRSLEEAGALKAFQNLITPIAQLFVALNLLSLPILSRAYVSAGEEKARRLLFKLAIVYICFLLIYLVPIHMWGNSIIFWLYKNSYYLSYSKVLILIEVIIVLYVPAFLLGLRARYLERPKSILYAKTASAFVTIILIIPIISKLGLSGAFLLLLLGLIAEIIIFLITTQAKTRNT